MLRNDGLNRSDSTKMHGATIRFNFAYYCFRNNDYYYNYFIITLHPLFEGENSPPFVLFFVETVPLPDEG